jgi:hypothetical protein
MARTVAVSAVLTEIADPDIVVFAAPAEIVAVAGNVIDGEVLDSVIVSAAGAGAARDTEQPKDAGVFIEVGVQVMPLSVGTEVLPVPLGFATRKLLIAMSEAKYPPVYI